VIHGDARIVLGTRYLAHVECEFGACNVNRPACVRQVERDAARDRFQEGRVRKPVCMSIPVQVDLDPVSTPVQSPHHRACRQRADGPTMRIRRRPKVQIGPGDDPEEGCTALPQSRFVGAIGTELAEVGCGGIEDVAVIDEAADLGTQLEKALIESPFARRQSIARA
jgi:hypothetical protein